MRHTVRMVVTLGVLLGLLSGASLAQGAYRLDLLKSGGGSGGVVSRPGGISCGSGCPSTFATYTSVRLVTLSAAPAAGSWFGGWSGGCAGQALDCQVTMDAAKTVTANFTATAPAVPDWSRVLGGAGADAARAVRQTADGGSVVAGEMNGDAWVLKLSATGAVEWQKVYATVAFESLNDIRPTGDGGYIAAGRSGTEAWVVRLASDGTPLWQYAYGGTSSAQALSVQQANDGGYVFAGLVSPLGAGGISDTWVVKLDANGAMVWEKAYGGTGYDAASSIQQTADGGYIVAGQYDTGGYNLDAWVLKISVLGDVEWQQRFGISGQLASIRQTADGGYVAAGQNGADAWFVRLAANGAVNWQKAYNHYGSQAASAIAETGDGSFVASTMGALLRISADGVNILWESDYAPINGDQLYGLEPASDGGFLAVGASGPSFESELWLLKVNGSGGVSGWTRPITSTFTATAAAATPTAVTPAGSGSTSGATAAVAQTYFTLTVKRTGSGHGLVTGFESPRPLIDCGRLCMAVYPANSAIDLSATPFPSSSFGGWSGGGCSGTGLCTVTLAADTQVDAPFANVSGTVVLSEGFDSAALPAGWTIVTAPGDTAWASFASSNSPLALNSARGGGGYAVADAMSMSELRTPLLNLSAYNAATLQFRSEGGGGTATVDVSTDGGATWQNAFARSGSFSAGSTTSLVNVSGAAGSAAAMLRLKFVGGDSNNWNVDDLQLVGFTDTAAPVDGVLSAAPGSGSVTLTWQPATDSGSGVAAYLLASSGTAPPADCSGATDLGTDTSYLHTGLVNGTTYYYRVCARDRAGNTSAGATASAAPIASVVTISPAAATYPAQLVGSSSAAQSFTLTNTSSTIVANVTSLFAAGTAAGDYVVDASGCGSVPPYFLYYLSSCTVTVSFAPQPGAAPDRRAVLSAVTDEAGAPTLSAALTGSATVSIVATAGTNGSITPAGTTVLAAGASQAYSITPLPGYRVASLLVDGSPVEPASSYTFSNVTASHTIDVTFVLIQYTVTVAAGTGGSVTPVSPQIVLPNATPSFTVGVDTANGYRSVVVNGCGGVLDNMVYTIAPAAADCTVTATFSQLPDGVIVTAPNKAVPSVADAIRALKISLGMLPATPADLLNGDVGPLLNGVPQPDGIISLGDAVVLLRRALGLASW